MKHRFIATLLLLPTVAFSQVNLRWDAGVTLTAVGQSGTITQTTSPITATYTATEFTAGAGNPDPFEIRGTGNGRLTPLGTNQPLPTSEGNAITVSTIFDTSTVPDQLFVTDFFQAWENRIDQFGVEVFSDLLVTLHSSTWDTSNLLTGATGVTSEGLPYTITGNQLHIINNTGANITGAGLAGTTIFQSLGSVTGFDARYDDINQSHSATFQITDTFTAIPEPSSTALLGLGALGLISRRKRG